MHKSQGQQVCACRCVCVSVRMGTNKRGKHTVVCNSLLRVTPQCVVECVRAARWSWGLRVETYGL